MMPNNLTFSPGLAVIKCFNIIFVLLLQKLSNQNKEFIRYSILNGFWGEYEYKLMVKSFMTVRPGEC